MTASIAEPVSIAEPSSIVAPSIVPSAAPLAASQATQATQSRVKKQYEQLPYPFRNPEDEKRRMVVTGLDDLTVVNHWCFHGKKDFTKPGRILIAGGGTGDSVVYLAHQLRKSPVELVYVDLSEASMKVAQARVKVRGLERKVTWILGSLTELDQYGVGQFDYINCSGVLHHLPDPVVGLRSLRACLKPDGALGIMVYAQYGRTAVYHMQALFQQLLKGVDDCDEKLAVARQVFSQLPSSNWYFRGQDLFPSIEMTDDTELYDLFLHSQDRAYTVPQLHDFLTQAKLHLVQFTGEFRLWYDPAHAFSDPAMLERVRSQPVAAQQAICEVLWGCIHKHSFWASADPSPSANPTDITLAPQLTHHAVVLDLAQRMQACTTDTFVIDFISGPRTTNIALDCNRLSQRYLALIDGRRTLGELIDVLVAELQEPMHLVWLKVQSLQRLLMSFDLLVMRDPRLPLLPR
jgi:SAM-dependent methyltransferase